jgi:hypothetical protein
MTSRLILQQCHLQASFLLQLLMLQEHLMRSQLPCQQGTCCRRSCWTNSSHLQLSAAHTAVALWVPLSQLMAKQLQG